MRLYGIQRHFFSLFRDRLLLHSQPHNTCNSHLYHIHRLFRKHEHNSTSHQADFTTPHFLTTPNTFLVEIQKVDLTLPHQVKRKKALLESNLSGLA
jgi:hypothetical protein